MTTTEFGWQHVVARVFRLFQFYFFLNIYANVVLIYCLDMSDKQMHPWILKILIDDHFPGCVPNLKRFTFITTHIQTKLTDTQLGLFKKLIFGHV